MGKDFLLQMSLTTGFGNNKTSDPEKFPKVLSLIPSKILFLKLKLKINNTFRCYNCRFSRIDIEKTTFEKFEEICE